MWLSKVRSFLSEMNSIEFRKFILIYMGAFTSVVGFLIFFYISQELTIKDQAKALNKYRTQVQQILTDYQKVAQQKESVSELLASTDTFYLQQFVQSSLETIGITTSSIGKVSSQTVNGYTEESVSVQLTDINTKELCELLQTIEETSRVYVKNVTITRIEGASSISASMFIATLKQSDG